MRPEADVLADSGAAVAGDPPTVPRSMVRPVDDEAGAEATTDVVGSRVPTVKPMVVPMENDEAEEAGLRVAEALEIISEAWLGEMVWVEGGRGVADTVTVTVTRSTGLEVGTATDVLEAGAGTEEVASQSSSSPSPFSSSSPPSESQSSSLPPDVPVDEGVDDEAVDDGLPPEPAPVTSPVAPAALMRDCALFSLVQIRACEYGHV